jgi:hypothetical protein
MGLSFLDYTAMTIEIAALQDTLQDLHVPVEFKIHDNANDVDVTARLEAWKQRTPTILANLGQKLQDQQELTSDEKAEIVSTVAQFDGEGSWITDAVRSLAQGEIATLKPVLQATHDQVTRNPEAICQR